MPKNKTLYIREEDIAVWEEAKRMLAYYQRTSLSVFLTKAVRQYVEEETARQAHATKGLEDI